MQTNLPVAPLSITRLAIVATLAACSAVSSLATASPTDRFEQRFDRRQAAQEQRIDRGVESGRLNAAEANRLQRQQDRLARAEVRAGADGHVTLREAAALEQGQDRAARRIGRQARDGQASGN